jgi:hypothetical protein
VICGVQRLPFVAGIATLDYGCAVLIDRNDLPNHLFGIPDLDLSEDLCAEPLAGPWFRLGACSTGSGWDKRGAGGMPADFRTFVIALPRSTRTAFRS